MSVKKHTSAVAASTVSLRTVDTLLGEVEIEGIQPYVTALVRLRKQKPGTRAYENALSDVSTAAMILETKARTATEVIDEYVDTLPD